MICDWNMKFRWLLAETWNYRVSVTKEIQGVHCSQYFYQNNSWNKNKKTNSNCSQLQKPKFFSLFVNLKKSFIQNQICIFIKAVLFVCIMRPPSPPSSLKVPSYGICLKCFPAIILVKLWGGDGLGGRGGFSPSGGLSPSEDSIKDGRWLLAGRGNELVWGKGTKLETSLYILIFLSNN